MLGDTLEGGQMAFGSARTSCRDECGLPGLVILRILVGDRLLRCGLLLIASQAVVEVGVSIPMAPLGWAPVFLPRHFGHSLLSSHPSGTWHTSSMHIWQ